MADRSPLDYPTVKASPDANPVLAFDQTKVSATKTVQLLLRETSCVKCRYSPVKCYSHSIINDHFNFLISLSLSLGLPAVPSKIPSM